MADETDVVKANAHVPLSDRAVHKLWKVREDAYKELTGKFGSAAEDSKIYPDFAPLLSKFARDANAPAQLLGLEAVAKYADLAPPPLVRRVAAEVSKGVVEKGLTGRAANKARAGDALLMFVGADAGDIVVDAVVGVGFKHRTPKVVAACLDVLRSAVLTYGSSAVPVKPMAAGLTPLFTHSNEPVRKAAKALVVELHRWVGDAIKSVLKDAPEVTVKELNGAFAENAGQPRPQPLKLTRAAEVRVREAPEGELDDGDDPFAAGGAVEEEELDLAEEIDLLPLLPKMKLDVDGEDEPAKDWYVSMESKKWKVRKASLEFAIAQIGEAKLTPGNYGDVVTRLRKVFAKDSNVFVVAQAAKMVAALAGGLKKNMAPPAAKALTVDLLARLKEKNKAAVEPIAAALDALHLKRCIQIAELCEDFGTAARNKVPKAREQLFRFLDRCFREGTPAADLKGGPLKKLGAMLVVATEDSAPDVRDASVSAIAALFVLVGERNMNVYMDKLDKIRSDKVMAIVKDLPPPKKLSAGGAGAKPAGGAAPKAKGQQKGPVTRARAAAGASAAAPKPKPKAPVYVSDDEGEVGIGDEDALTRAAARFEGFEAESWSAKSFKTRVACIGTIATVVNDVEAVEKDDAMTILALLSVRPGLSDPNFLAVKGKMELLGDVAEKSKEPLPRKTLKGLLELVVDKLGDIKCSMAAESVFMTISEATSARFFFEVLAAGAAKTNNGRAKIGMAKYATKMVQDFGLPAIPLKVGVELVATLLQEPPPALRTAALTLAANIALRGSPPEAFRKGLEDSGKVESSLLELFDAEVEKRKNSVEPPTRKRRFGSDASAADATPAEEPEAPAEVTESVPVAAPEPEPPVPEPSLPTRRRSLSSGPPSSRGGRQPPGRAGARTPSQRGSRDGSLSRRNSIASTEDPLVSSPAAASGVPKNVHAHFVAGSSIISGLKNSSWKSRHDALARIDSVLTGAGGSIAGNIGTDIMPELRRRFADSNRNVAALAYGVCGRMGEAMGQGALPHVKIVMPPVFSSGCVDIKRTVREAASKCLDQWVSAVGLSPMIAMLPAPLASLNPGFRKSYLEWLLPRLNGSIGSFCAADEDLTLLVTPILNCLRDRTADVRHLAEGALGNVIASVGFGVVEGKVQTLTKSARLQLEPIIGHFRQGAPPGRPGSGVAASPAPRTPGGRAGGRGGPKERPRSLALPSPRVPGRRDGGEGVEPSTPRSGLRRVRPQSVRGTPGATLESMMEPDTISYKSPFLRGGPGREERARRAVAAKTVDPSEREVPSALPYYTEVWDVLCEDLRDCVSEALFVKLTAPANRFQLHVEAIDQIVSAMREDPDKLVECADVLLRWAAYRIDDGRTPPTMLVKACTFVSSTCEVLLSSGSKLGDYEASAVIPVIVDKCGSNRPAVREAHLAALLSIGDVIDDQKMMAYLVSSMWETQSVRSRLEAANALPHIIERVCASGASPPERSMTVIAKVAYGSDDASGRAAAACIEQVHEHVGDDVWAMVGEVTDEQAELLESRFPQPGTHGASGLDGPGSPVPQRQHGTPAGTGGPAQFVAPPPPEYPKATIRTEDFRLSVAPAPPSNVMSVMGDSFGMETPGRPERGRLSTRGHVDQTPALPSRRPRGGAGNFSFISAHKSSTVQTVVDLLGSPDRKDQEQGLVHLFDDLSEHHSPFLYECASEILPLLSRGFRDCVERLELPSADAREQHVLKQYLNALMAYVSAPSVIRGVDQGTIEQLLSDVMDAMIPDDVPRVDDWERVRRGVNLAVLKILETCDRNLLFTALFNLLLVELRMEADPSEKPLAKSQLLAKSIAKVTKRGFSNITVEALLRDIGLFVTSIAPSQTSGDCIADNDVTGTVVRSVLDPLVDELGQDVYSKLSLIPSQSTSPIVDYISKLLPRVPGDDGTLRDPVLAAAVEAQAATVLRGVDGSNPHDKLAEIFAHLLSSGGHDAGLRRLRAFTVCYPDVDVQPHLSKCSVHFQKFIRDGLDRISSESGSTSSSPSRSTGSSPRLSSRSSDSKIPRSSGLESSGQAYLKRLREIQLKYGLPEHKREDSTAAEAETQSETDVRESNTALGSRSFGSSGTSDFTSSVPNPIEKENGTSEGDGSVDTRDKATALRERMARIREASGER